MIETLLLAAAAAIVFILAAVGLAWVITVKRAGAIRLTAVRGGYRARTPAGPASVRLVFDDRRGFVYEVRPRFRGGSNGPHLIAPSTVVLTSTLTRLADEHLTARRR